MEKKLTFEESMDKLEQIVKKLECQDTPLEDALALFEQGIALSDACAKQLENAKVKVSMLTSKGGELKTEEFLPNE